MEEFDHVRARVLEFLDKYGEKGVLLLEAILEAADQPYSGVRHGDFSYKQVVHILRRRGVSYNPSNLLRVLERTYGLIEKTYFSSNQRWWVLVDRDGVRAALDEYLGVDEVIEEPRRRVLEAKYAALDPENLLDTLRRLAAKPRLGPMDKRMYREIAFGELDHVASLLEEMAAYPHIFRREIKVLSQILAYAERVARKITGREPVARRGVEEKIVGKEAGVERQ